MGTPDQSPFVPSLPNPREDEAAYTGNPFLSDVCADPLQVREARSVPGMNEGVLRHLSAAVDERHRQSGRAVGQPIMLLTAPRAGYGKTHLMGRLAAAADGQLVLIPLAFRMDDEIS